jgi:hypothetical protein
VTGEQAQAGEVRRVLILDLDSVAQSRVFGELGEAEAVRALIGQLRLALLLYDRVYVTHAMVLDGHLFRGVSPDECAQLLGCSPRDMPLTVLAPGDRLADALAGMLNNSDFVWQTRAPKAADVSLRAWVDAAEAGRMACKPYAETAAAADAPFIRSTPVAGAVPGMSAEGEALLVRAAAAPSRSAAFSALKELREESPSEFDLAHAWYDREYLQEVAERNSASWLSFGALPQAVKGRAQLAVPQDLLTFCEQVPPAMYAQARYRTRVLREEFSMSHNRAGLLSIAFATLESATPEGNLRHRMVMPVVRLVAAIVTIAMGAFALAPTGTSWWLPFASFGVLALTTVPWSDLRLFFELRRFSKAATLSVALTGARHG